MEIKIKNKKLKRRLKRIYTKITPWRRKYVLDKIPVFTVKQICKILHIKVPKVYKPIQNIPVHFTYLFDTIQNKDEVRKQISYHNYRRPNFVRQLKWKMNRFKFGFDNQIEILEGTDEKLIKMIVEWLYGWFPIGYYYFDYLDYELYNKTIEEANTFLSRGFWWRTYKASNDGKAIKVLKDKEQFNKVYHKYVNREFLNCENCSFEEFEKFVKAHPKFFGKPVEGTGGEGAGIIRVSDFDSIDDLYKHSKKNHLIIEEIVQQHKDLAKFNDSAVNTIRAYSLHCADGKVRVLLANLRLSRKGKDVDNFHCGGVTCVIDTKTGIVKSDAIDRHHRFYEKHPDSGLKFKGFQVPCWDKLVKAIEESGCLVPGIRHIGWDIAVTKDGNIELIEGNSMPNFDVTQAADQVGKLHVYEKYIIELEELKKEEKKKKLAKAKKSEKKDVK